VKLYQGRAAESRAGFGAVAPLRIPRRLSAVLQRLFAVPQSGFVVLRSRFGLLRRRFGDSRAASWYRGACPRITKAVSSSPRRAWGFRRRSGTLQRLFAELQSGVVVFRAPLSHREAPLELWGGSSSSTEKLRNTARNHPSGMLFDFGTRECQQRTETADLSSSSSHKTISFQHVGSSTAGGTQRASKASAKRS
jgi:hypothetical protein